MKTAKQREEEFKVELGVLLEKHGAEIDLVNNCGDYFITVLMPPEFSGNGISVLEEGAEFIL